MKETRVQHIHLISIKISLHLFGFSILDLLLSLASHGDHPTEGSHHGRAVASTHHPISKYERRLTSLFQGAEQHLMIRKDQGMDRRLLCETNKVLAATILSLKVQRKLAKKGLGWP